MWARQPIRVQWSTKSTQIQRRVGRTTDWGRRPHLTQIGKSKWSAKAQNNAREKSRTNEMDPAMTQVVPSFEFRHDLLNNSQNLNHCEFNRPKAWQLVLGAKALTVPSHLPELTSVTHPPRRLSHHLMASLELFFRR